MRLYLAQHGEAVSGDVDPSRPLSGVGRGDAVAVAEFLAGAGVRVARALSSGKRRAKETAEILAAAVAPGVDVDEMAAGLAPNDLTYWLATEAEGWTADTLVVGHLPFMGRAVSRLVTRADAPVIVAFIPGTVVCLERSTLGAWTVLWMITPDLVRRSRPV